MNGRRKCWIQLQLDQALERFHSKIQLITMQSFNSQTVLPPVKVRPEYTKTRAANQSTCRSQLIKMFITRTKIRLISFIHLTNLGLTRKVLCIVIHVNMTLGKHQWMLLSSIIIRNQESKHLVRKLNVNLGLLNQNPKSTLN